MSGSLHGTPWISTTLANVTQWVKSPNRFMGAHSHSEQQPRKDRSNPDIFSRQAFRYPPASVFAAGIRSTSQARWQVLGLGSILWLLEGNPRDSRMVAHTASTSVYLSMLLSWASPDLTEKRNKSRLFVVSREKRCNHRISSWRSCGDIGLI
jgi:hypothetical protein